MPFNNQICGFQFNTTPCTLDAPGVAFINQEPSVLHFERQKRLLQGSSENEDSLRIIDLAVLLATGTPLLTGLTLRIDPGNTGNDTSKLTQDIWNTALFCLLIVTMPTLFREGKLGCLKNSILLF